jgi:hypothetical protein
MIQLLLWTPRSIERVTAFDGILAGDAIKMVSQRENSTKKAFMVRTSSGMQARRRQLILSPGINKSPIFDQMMGLLSTRFEPSCLEAFSES